MQTFLKVLDPEDTSTGGGSASAIAGAMAASLLAMVSRLSDSDLEGVEKDFYERLSVRAGQLSQQLLEGSQEDSQAFQSVRSAYRLPKQSGEEITARQQAIQAAWLNAACVPMANAQRCLQVMELGTELVHRVNPKVQSDYSCALLLAHAGGLGCLENVYINLASLKDTTLAEQLANQAAGLKDRFASLEVTSMLHAPGE